MQLSKGVLVVLVFGTLIMQVYNCSLLLISHFSGSIRERYGDDRCWDDCLDAISFPVRESELHINRSLCLCFCLVVGAVPVLLCYIIFPEASGTNPDYSWTAARRSSNILWAFSPITPVFIWFWPSVLGRRFLPDSKTYCNLAGNQAVWAWCQSRK